MRPISTQILWLLLIGCMPPSPQVLAQTARLDFPARAAWIDLAEERLDPYLVGGHTLARLDLGTLAAEPLANLAEQTITGGASRGAAACLLFGSQRHESGWAGKYDAPSRQFAWQSELPAPITSGCTQADGLLLGDERGTVRRLESDTGQVLWAAELHVKMVTAVSDISPQLAASGDWLGNIQMFDPSSGRLLGSLRQHRDRITGLVSLAAPADSFPRFASGSRDGTVRLWYPQQGRMVRFVQVDAPVTTLAAIPPSKDGSISEWMVLAATQQGPLHVIDLSVARVIRTIPSPLEDVVAMLPLADKRWLALDGRGNVALFTL